MPVLTMRELAILRGRPGSHQATSEEMRTAEKKLQDFQRRNTDSLHVEAVNSFIPQADQWAKDKAVESVKELGGQLDDYFTQAYCAEMNRLTAEAGLRVSTTKIPSMGLKN